MAQLVILHAATQTDGRQKTHVVDTDFGRHLEHRFDDALAGVGAAHRRQRRRAVIEGNRQHGRGGEQRAQGSAVERCGQRFVDGSSWVLLSGERLGSIDDPAAGGQALGGQFVASPDEYGRCRRVYVECETGAGHQNLSSAVMRACR